MRQCDTSQEPEEARFIGPALSLQVAGRWPASDTAGGLPRHLEAWNTWNHCFPLRPGGHLPRGSRAGRWPGAQHVRYGRTYGAPTIFLPFWLPTGSHLRRLPGGAPRVVPPVDSPGTWYVAILKRISRIKPKYGLFILLLFLPGTVGGCRFQGCRLPGGQPRG